MTEQTNVEWLLDRLFELEADPTEACVIWPFAARADGYGVISARCGVPKRKRLYYVHVLAFAYAFGPIPEELSVLHMCDCPRCFNPAHLFPGTTEMNMLDARDKGRTLAGGRNPGAKLTLDQVGEIRSLHLCGVTQTALAQHYGVGRTQVGRIVRGRKWAARST